MPRSEERRSLFVEALPCFDVLKARANWRREKPVLLWTDQRLRQVGWLRIHAFDEEDVAARYTIHQSHRFEGAGGLIRVSLLWQKRDGVHPRPQAFCPECKGRCEKMYFVEGLWGCRKCQDLLYLSQRLTRLQRDYLRYDTLTQEVMYEKRSRLPIFESALLVARYNRAREKVEAFERPPLAPDLRHRVNSHWITQADFELAEAARLKGPASEIAASLGDEPDEEAWWEADRQRPADGEP